MKENITLSEIEHLYKFCGLSIDSGIFSRTTINTGNLYGNYNDSFNFVHKFMSSADLLRWQ